MNINGRLHHADCGSGGGFGTSQCYSCSHILCAPCGREIPVSEWPRHALGHKGEFCAKRGPAICRLRPGHDGPHLGALRLSEWAETA